MSAGIILFAAFAVCLIVGVPVSISLGVASLCSVVFGGLSASSTVIAQRIFGGLQSTSIMAIAFFVLAGNLMTKGGISRRIVNFANCLVGNVRGGMSLALVLACAFFAALSGSAPATVIAIGTMLYNDMVKLGYPGDRTAGLLVVSGGLGPIIPPSIIMVIYCTLTGASVGNMFKQGMLIGIVKRWHLPPYRKFRQLPGRQCARRNEPGTGFSLRILRSLIRFRSCNCYCYRYHALQ